MPHLQRKVVIPIILFIFFITASLRAVEYPFWSYTARPSAIQLFYKNDKGERFGSLGKLKLWLQQKGKTLRFAANGGMYKADHSPVGLFIQNGQIISPLNTGKNSSGNFYMQPNGIFYIADNNIAAVVVTDSFNNNGHIKFATQSGPMLVVNGKINPAFNQHSTNLNVRNGVGILPNGNVLFAISKGPVNFWDMANFFVSYKCTQALYLDGYVSRTYQPSDNILQEDGDFGVIIGVTD